MPNSLAYYNEHDSKAAAWLRELICEGHIADGIVDERSIEDVTPNDLKDFTQCHFFAGIGGWSLALRRAGWPDERPVWTGSCPCQPFSAAGKNAGFTDERHLWPAWHWLIGQCHPAVIFGEQVSAKAADNWIDLVSTDLEALDYAVGAVAFPAASVGAPHVRDRCYFVADGERAGLEGLAGHGDGSDQPGRIEACATGSAATGGSFSNVADADGGHASTEREQRSRQHRQQPQDGSTEQLEHATRNGRQQWRPESSGRGAISGRGSLHFWSDAEWIYCTDGKYRPVEPGTFPLAHGVPARVGRLRGYGNAINVEAARAFIEAVMT